MTIPLFLNMLTCGPMSHGWKGTWQELAHIKICTCVHTNERMNKWTYHCLVSTCRHVTHPKRSTCHTSQKVDTLTRMFATYEMSTCQPVTHVPEGWYFNQNTSKYWPVTQSIKSTLWPVWFLHFWSLVALNLGVWIHQLYSYTTNISLLLELCFLGGGILKLFRNMHTSHWLKITNWLCCSEHAIEDWKKPNIWLIIASMTIIWAGAWRRG